MFAAPKDSLGTLEAEVASALIAASSDVALVLDSDGVIRDVAFGSEELSQEGYDSWVGKPWLDTVTLESKPKIQELLKDSASKSITRWRQVNHPSSRGPDIPIRYAAVRLGQGDRTVIVGRDLRSLAALQRRLAEAQQSMERDYERIRGAETRYRLLFQLTSEPVVIVDAASQKVVDINPAGAELIGRPVKRVVGQPLAESFDPASAETIQSLLAAARVTGRVDNHTVRLAETGGEFLASASLFRQENATLFLLRLAPIVADAPVTDSTSRGRATMLAMLQKLPEGLVVTDGSLKILVGNQAFLDMVQLATEEQVRGESLERWLGRPGVDAGVLVGNLMEHGSVRQFGTILRGEYGAVEDVEVAAVSAPNGDETCFGFSLRLRRARQAPAVGHELPRSVEQLTQLVGRVSLKNLVRETTDMIERLCIEAALELTRDNRASAAEMLGLSRQSLYSKLRRYGLGDLDGDDKPDNDPRG
jgi:transcriptional regulator PpsR